MVVHQPPRWPEFGAAETKLRYDAPISLLARDGKLSSMSYASGWDPKFKDVVVTMPNGTRFVFWRGSCYIPFWVSRHNVGFNYEWAEAMPPADAVDCVEPLMDKELRYGRVRIVESTPARVHVRWNYQSCDFNYKVWGDSAVEDYYFYPDGFGTRVLTLQSDPKTANYELSELIVLTPQSNYPLSIFPSNMVDMLFLDGQKREIAFSVLRERARREEEAAQHAGNLPRTPAQGRTAGGDLLQSTRCESAGGVLRSFLRQGRVGHFFLLGQSLAAGARQDHGIRHRRPGSLTPCHNSIMSWCKNRPTPVRTAQFDTIDTLGRSKPMQVQTWVWLIGMSDAGDSRLLEWAAQFLGASLAGTQGRPACPRIVCPRAPCDPHGCGR